MGFFLQGTTREPTGTPQGVLEYSHGPHISALELTPQTANLTLFLNSWRSIIPELDERTPEASM